ncbi:TIGR00341 family protein [Hyphobacterium marinum]|uniref:TIGR00341 family protein n=1 Tax=Hyphobacterium marinum TaxID=3116574 RepID=A0ABU7LYQ8_9PROT|nr:TIGR00341 family protein [Hyphobacterium sp. Y6023]MEE2566691.1 TIGR00341 family protein [Hyphobacterium sp. Y6023]
MRLIEITFPESVDTKPLLKSCLRAEPVDYRLDPADERGRRLLRLVFRSGDGQEAIDAVQSLLADETDWRLVVLPIEASLPAEEKPEEEPAEDEAQKKHRKTIALREELYEDISKGAVLNRDFLLLTALSAVVAALGLNANNVAAVIGAMVIAPLLGPILAFAFGSALGDLDLMLKSARTAMTGLVVGLLVAMALGAAISANLGSDELVSRTFVGVDAVALALAAGAAAALSISTGVSSALVGVMVAVALLPPSAAVGIFLGDGEWGLALRAALLLAINVVSVLLAALFIFRVKGVRPRTWLERRSAKRSVFINYGVWAVCILVLTVIAWRIAPVEVLP